MVLKASCRPATPKSTLSAWASSARCAQARSCLRPFAGFLSCLRSSPQCPRSLLLYFFRFLLKRQPLCRTSLGHPVSTTTHVLRTFCAFNLLYYFFFKAPIIIRNSIFSTFSVLMCFLPATPVSSVRVGPSGSPPQPLCPKQGCCRNGWVHSARSYRWTSGHG